MFFLKSHLIDGSFRNTYTDTDSVCLATTSSRKIDSNMSIEEEYRAIFDPIVRPEMRESWEKNWKSWFVTTKEVEDQRFPGKLKRKWNFTLFDPYCVLEEFSFTKGQFVALAPKTYMAFNSDPDARDKIKCGTKGIPHSQKLCLDAFLTKLYNHTEHKVTIKSLRLNNQRVMSRITMIKAGLSDLCIKFPISDDMITCTPLCKNGQYLWTQL